MSAPRSPSHDRPTPLSEFLFGSAYYPEHWDARTRAGDPALFRAAGWNVVRMAEFAWNVLEPRQGTFDFALFDETIARMGEAGIRTILCTPTASPPRWLTRDHPEVLRVTADGRRHEHGSRQHTSCFSPVLRERARAIVRAMAEHYRDNSCVIGWQTDNEFFCHGFEDYSVAAQLAWSEWLRRRFDGDVSALNCVWGTAFWGQEYERFEDVVLPRPGRPTWDNPAQALAYRRFLSDGVTSFQREQVDILRAANPAWFVTHNGFFPGIDYRGDFGRDLDFNSYDSYPMFEYDPQERAAGHAAALDRARAFGGNFLVLEHQCGAGGQGDYLHDTPEPGEMRRMAWASVARGADGLLLFRERTCRFGAEQYWAGVLDHDNRPRRRSREAAALGAELARIGPRLLGTSVRVDVAVAGGDFGAQHGHDVLSHGLPSPKRMGEEVHGVLFRAGHAVGFVHPEDDLEGVRLLVVPHFAVFDPQWVPALERFVDEGGTLVIGARTGTKDPDNNVVGNAPPGALRSLVGASVEEYGRQNRPDRRLLELRMAGEEADTPTTLWYELLVPDAGSETLATWRTRHLAGTPAIVGRRHGKGRVLYVGTYLTREFFAALLPVLRRLGALPTPLSSTPGLELVERIGQDGRAIRFAINHNERPVQVAVPACTRSEWIGEGVYKEDGSLELASNGVAVFPCDPKT